MWVTVLETCKLSVYVSVFELAPEHSISDITSVDDYLQAVGSLATTATYLLHIGDNSTINSTELAGVLDKVGEYEFVVLAVQPVQAYEIWTAAYKLVYIGEHQTGS